jgi:argininosuccinate lyase
MEGLDVAVSCVTAMEAAVSGLVVDREAMRRAIPAEVYATDAALDLVAEGVPFREAYRRVGTSLDSVTPPDPLEALARRSADGSPGNLNLASPRERAAGFRKRLALRVARLDRAVIDLVGHGVELAPEASAD